MATTVDPFILVEPKVITNKPTIVSPKKQTSVQSPRDPESVTPKPLQLNTGYYDEKGDFIPPGVLKAPFSGKLFNISEKSGLDGFLKHLLEDYRLVIADLTKIADFTLYMRYWTERFDMQRNTQTPSIDETLTLFCTPIQTNPLNPRPEKIEKSGDENLKKLVEKVTYYLLSDNLPEDKQLRESLQLDRLEYVLSLQEQERKDRTFTGKCFFCKYRVTKGNRADLILHMTQCHKFQIGHPDNIVLASEFLSKIKSYFDENICVYCGKKFKDKSTLLEHMKKKKHRSLDPNNKEWDRYYVINYLEPGKHWSDYQDEIKMQEQIEQQLRKDNKLKGRFLQQTFSTSGTLSISQPIVPGSAGTETKLNADSKRKMTPSESGTFNPNASVFVPKSQQKVEPEPEKQEKSLFDVTTPREGANSKNNSDEADTDNEDDWIEKPDYSNQCFKCLFLWVGLKMHCNEVLNDHRKYFTIFEPHPSILRQLFHLRGRMPKSHDHHL